MKPRRRSFLFVSAAFALFGLMVWGVLGLSPFGLYPGPYGDVLNAVAYRERHVLNVVTSVIFDYRGFDTLGEEFILFACVTGVTLLMRHEGVQSEEDCPPEPPRGQGREPPAFPPASEATQFFSAGYIGLLLVFGVYVVLTGHLSVGGGFQGGLLLSSAWLLALVAFGSRTFRRFSNNYVVEWFESTGAAAYVLIGLAGLAVGQNFLTNILPLGQPGQLLSSGTILLINCGVGVEVAAGFISLFCEFVKPLENEGPER